MDKNEPIQLFVPHFRVDETLAEIRECLEKGWTGLGFKTVAFENAWSTYSGLPHSHFVNSATVGLQLALRLLSENDGWSEGDEVITTALTFVSTNHVILHERLTPVFADVDEFLCLDPASVEAQITPRTRAVIFVGLGGNTGRLQEVAELCQKRGLRLILDAAHMAGTRWSSGMHVGPEADVTVFSFQAVKNLPTADSGMICFRDAKLDEEVRKWTWLGINKDTYSRTHSQGSYKWMYDVEHVGFKSHGNSIMAAMGLVSLRYLDIDNAYRRQLATWYDQRLTEIAGVSRIPMSTECESSRHLYQIAVDKRDEVMLALNSQGVYPGVHYRENTAYRMYEGGAASVPVARYMSDRLISLPMHMKVTKQDVDRVAGILASVVDSSAKNVSLELAKLRGQYANATSAIQRVLTNEVAVARPRS